MVTEFNSLRQSRLDQQGAVMSPTNGRSVDLRWVGWREEEEAGKDGKPIVGEEGKPKKTKVPYDPKTGRQASSTNPTTWATQDEAEQWANRYGGNGVGIVLGQLDNGDALCGVDLDTCRSPATGDFTPWAREIIDRFATYTEISPSGTGAKAFFAVANNDLTTAKALLDGKSGRSFKNGEGEHPPGIEVYIGGRYFTVTKKAISTRAQGTARRARGSAMADPRSRAEIRR